MENESIGKRGMGINYKGSQGIMKLFLVALPGFLIILVVTGIVNVMCLVVPAAACLHIVDSLGAILIAQWAQ
jgi:hypothetical protein